MFKLDSYVETWTLSGDEMDHKVVLSIEIALNTLEFKSSYDYLDDQGNQIPSARKDEDHH